MRAIPQQPAELPPYRAVLVVDVKDFSGRKSRFHKEITCQIPIILENAFTRCGHAELWGQGFGDTTGDGYFHILDPVYLPYLLNPFLAALQDELTDQNSMLPQEYGNLRMRVSLSVGPVTDSGEALLGDGNGATRIEAHRILDSDPVRDILERSNDVTRVAAIVSQRVYEDAVLSGYAAEEAEEYVEVEAEVKSFEGRGYLRVPKPSGRLLREGFVVGKPDGDQVANEPGHQAGRERQEASSSLFGSVQATNATLVNRAEKPIASGSGNQFNLGDRGGADVDG